MHPEKIASFLGLPLKKACRKGDPTGASWPEVHPYNIAIFGPEISGDASMEVHLSQLLEFIEPIKKKCHALTRYCVVKINCLCALENEGGWTLENELINRLAATRLGVVVSIVKSDKQVEE